MKEYVLELGGHTPTYVIRRKGRCALNLCSEGLSVVLSIPNGGTLPCSMRLRLSRTRPSPSKGWRLARLGQSDVWGMRWLHIGRKSVLLLSSHLRALRSATGGSKAFWMCIDEIHHEPPA